MFLSRHVAHTLCLDQLNGCTVIQSVFTCILLYYCTDEVYITLWTLVLKNLAPESKLILARLICIIQSICEHKARQVAHTLFSDIVVDFRKAFFLCSSQFKTMFCTWQSWTGRGVYEYYGITPGNRGVAQNQFLFCSDFNSYFLDCRISASLKVRKCCDTIFCSIYC